MKKVPKPVQRKRAGIRCRFRDMMDPSRFTFPRKTLINHKIEWYLDGSAADRPVFGLYAMACFAEYILHHARFGRRGQGDAIQDAARFHASAIRALQNALSTYDIGKRIPDSGVEALRRVVYRLVAEADLAYNVVMKGTTRRTCPACAGRGKLSAKDYELLEAILYEQSRNGTISRFSKLFRENPLTPITGQ